MAKTGEGTMMGPIIAKAWSDPEFKRRLMDDPATVLRQEGIPVPEGVAVKAVENTRSLIHLVIPPKPSFELTDDELDACAAGGVTGGCCLFDSHGYGILW